MINMKRKDRNQRETGLKQVGENPSQNRVIWDMSKYSVFLGEIFGGSFTFKSWTSSSSRVGLDIVKRGTFWRESEI